MITKTNDKKGLQLIDIYAKTKITSMWSQDVYQYFKMEAILWP